MHLPHLGEQAAFQAQVSRYRARDDPGGTHPGLLRALGLPHAQGRDSESALKVRNGA